MRKGSNENALFCNAESNSTRVVFGVFITKRFSLNVFVCGYIFSLAFEPKWFKDFQSALGYLLRVSFLLYARVYCISSSERENSEYINIV